MSDLPKPDSDLTEEEKKTAEKLRELKHEIQVKKIELGTLIDQFTELAPKCPHPLEDTAVLDLHCTLCGNVSALNSLSELL